MQEDISHTANNGSVHNASVFAVFSNLNITFSFFSIVVEALGILASRRSCANVMPRLQNALRSTIQNSMRTTRTTRNQRANEVNSFTY